jgi:hypothetical protein
MSQVLIDFNQKAGKMKPMHAVNNGPVYKFAADQRITNIDAFREAGIPYARNHDAAFYSTYGGEHTVDVHNIFPDFDKDPSDPSSYDFAMTDEYVKVCEFAGVKTYYRLGSKIEHGVKKYGTLPPKDFKKWAVICEHIIRHYTEGWADGFRYDIEYWEIWNEPDLDPDDSTHKRCWGGTAKQFYELYCIAYKHLKSSFPHLKIGGPACCGLDRAWLDGFFTSLKENGIAPDFFSWHIYASEVESVVENVRFARRILNEYGFENTESILNEWNYGKGWVGNEWIYSLRAEKSLKGAAFIAAVMEACQYEDVDMLMYYDARPCAMNGMFSTDLICNKLKGYYPFYMFNQLYRLDSAVKTVSDDDDVYAAAAVSENEAAVMITSYSDDDEKGGSEVSVDLSGFGSDGCKVEVYLLNEDHNAELVSKALYFGDRFIPTLFMSNLSTCLIKLRRI